MLPSMLQAGSMYAGAGIMPGYQMPRHSRGMPLVKLRGLPFRCEDADVYEFFAGLDVVEVLFVRKEKRLTGEAYVLLASHTHADLALQRNKMYLGRRYVEVFRAKREEWYSAIANEVAEDGGSYQEEPKTTSSFARDVAGAGAAAAHSPAPAGFQSGAGSLASTVQAQLQAARSAHTGVLKLRGLPFSASIRDILDFFSGFPLAEDSVHIVTNTGGRSTGEAFVEFPSPDDARHAMLRDRALMGTRYVELYPSSRDEATSVAAKASSEQ